MLNFTYLLAGSAVLAIVMYFLKRSEVHSLNEKIKAAESEYNDSIGRIEKRSNKIERAILSNSKKISFVGEYDIGGVEFQKAILSISEKKELWFLFEQIHRKIYENSIMSTSDDMIVNAISKGKGVRLVENYIMNPSALIEQPEEGNQEDEG